MSLKAGVLFRLITVGMVPLLILTSGCANLESVRDFSKQSAYLTSGAQAVDYWAEWDDRAKRFDTIVARLPKVNGTAAKGPPGPVAPPTEEQVRAIKSLQAVLSIYMTQLGALAEGELVDVSTQVDGLVTNLNSLPVDDIEEQKTTNLAYGSILKLIKLPLDAYRHRKIRQLVAENDTNIQALTKGLAIAMESIAKMVAAEKQSVLNWYEVTTGDYAAPTNFAEAYQWEKDRSAIVESYDSKIDAIDAYKKSLTTIGSVHSELAEKLSTFNTQTFKTLVSSLQDARTEVAAARDQYNKAFK